MNLHTRFARVVATATATLAVLVVPPVSAQANQPDVVQAPDAVVSLGDSYSSGLGSGNYYNDCDNTPNAWGNLIFGAAVTDRTLLACSGATIDTVRGQVGELATLPSTGNRLITVTVGGNDAGFADELEYCFSWGCTGRQAEIEARIDGLLEPLTALYRDIQAAAPDDRILVGGYPLLVPDPDVRGWCTALTFLITSSERRMIRSLGMRMNDVIDQAAAQAGVTSVTTGLESRFTGHEACRNSSRDWLYGLKISFFGSGTQAEPTPDVIARYNPRPGVTADFVSDSFHPTKTGQSAYAATFEAVYYRAFT